MAKIRDATPKDAPEAYIRLLGDENIAKLLQRSQSTIISNGSELEKILLSHAANTATIIGKGELDEFLEKCQEHDIPNGCYVATKQAVKNSQIAVPKHEADFTIFLLTDKKQHCYIVEMKDGNNFDTKKAPSEVETLIKCQNAISSKIPFSTSIHICCFNQSNKDLIVSGFKNAITKDQAMTGEEFCQIIGINYKNIVQYRMEDAKDNLAYYLEQSTKAPVVGAYISSLKAKMLDQDDFYIEEEE